MNSISQHIWDLDAFKDSKKVVNARKYILAMECIFCVASGLIKISILLFYRRLASRVVSNAFRWTTWITIGYIIAYTIALTLAPILGCNPISAFWDRVNILKRLQGYEFECFDEGADLLAASIISTSQDLLTAVLPTFLYWNLQITKRQKLALFGIFAIGYGVVALGALRTYYSWRTFYDTYDLTWSSYDMFVTSLLELHVGAFCANAPTLKVFFKHLFYDKLALASRTSPSKAKDGKDSSPSQSKSTSSSTSLLGKVASLFRIPHSRYGYISESQASVSVDKHGGVEVDIIRYPLATAKLNDKHESFSTINILNAHYYNDIELGHSQSDDLWQMTSVRSTKTFEGSDISALPPMPQSPESARPPRPPTPRANMCMRTQILKAPEPLVLTLISEGERSEPTPTQIQTRNLYMNRHTW
jgi:hypothetical protein